MGSAIPFVEAKLKQRKIVVFSKRFSPEGKICQKIVESCKGLTKDRYEWINIDKRGDCAEIEDYLWVMSDQNQREVPLLFIKGRCKGGYYDILRMEQEGVLQRLFDKLCLKVEEEDEDLEEEERERRRKVITVRVVPLDQTEVQVLVASWMTVGPAPVDYDAYRDSGSQTALTSGMEVLAKRSVQESKEEGEKAVEEDPEWMYLGGKTRHRRSSVSIRLSAGSRSSLLMKRKSSTSAQAITSAPTGEIKEQNELPEPDKPDIA